MKAVLAMMTGVAFVSCGLQPAAANQVTQTEFKQEHDARVNREQFVLGVAAEGRDNALVANNRLSVAEPKIDTALGQAYNAGAEAQAAQQTSNTALDRAHNAQVEADKANAEVARAHQRIDELNAYTNSDATSIQRVAETREAVAADEPEAVTVEEAKAYVDNKVASVSQQVDRAERRVSGGVASSAALATIPFTQGETSLGVGVGHFNGQSAAALGVQGKLGDVRLRAGVASDSQNNFTAAAGVAIGL